MDVPLTVLGQRLRALTARRVGLAAYLWGEAGIGKSYTSRALLRGTPYRSLTLPARLSLPELVRTLPRPARLRDWTRAALDSLDAGQTMTVTTADLLAALLDQLSPFVLCLEDLHEADAARIQLTAQLAAAVARTRGAALLISSRLPPPEAWPEDALVLSLERLSPQASAVMLIAEAGAELPAGALVWIFERARGNPLFTLEYFRLLARQGHLWNDGERWRWREPAAGLLPLTVEAIIEHTLNQALEGPALANTFMAQALLPLGTAQALQAEVADLSVQTFSVAQQALEQRGVLLGGNFAHPLYREVGLRWLDPAQQQRLAGRALNALQTRDPQGAAAFIDLAGLAGPPALELLRRAADDAGKQQQPAQQARWLERALGHASGTERHPLAFQAARTLVEHDLKAAGALAEAAVRERPDDPETVILLAEIQARQLRLTEAEQGLDRLSTGPYTALTITAKRIELRSFARQYGAAVDLWEQWRSALDTQASAALHGQVAFCLILLDREDEAFELATAGLDRFECTPEERAKFLGLQAMYYSRRGLPSRAVTIFEQVAEEYERIGSPRRTAAAYANLAIALEQVGQYRQQAAAWEQSVSWREQAADPYQTGISRMALASVRTKLGQYQEAEDLLLDFQGLLRADDPATTLTYFSILCELYAAWRTPLSGLLLRRHAVQAVTQAREHGHRGYLADALGQLIPVEVEGGHLAQADALSLELLTLTGVQANPESQVTALRARATVLAALQRSDEADEALEQGEHLAAQHDLRDEFHLTGLDRARLSHDVARAREHLHWFRQQGLRTAIDQTLNFFPELAEQAGTDSGRTGPDGLLPVSEWPHLGVLGELRFRSAGGPAVQAVPVRGRQRCALLAALLEARLRGQGEASRLDLVDILYSQADEVHGLAALKELVHQTRTALGPGVIQTTEGGYMLGEVQSDAEIFLKTGETRLWRGPYLAGGVLEPDMLIQDTLYQALHACAQAMLATDPAEAARVGRLLCGASPYDWAALALTLRALRAAGNHRSLGRFYAAARQGFEEVGEALPADWAAFLEGHAPA